MSFESNSDLSDDANGGISVVQVNTTTTDNLLTAIAIPIAG